VIARLVPALLLASGIAPSQPEQKPSTTMFSFQQPTTVASAFTEVQTRFPGVIEDRADLRSSKVELSPGLRSFWSLLDEIATRSKTSFRVLATEGKIQFLPDGPSTTAVAVSGPFRLSLRRFTDSFDLETRTPSASATMEVAWEPGLQPFFLETRPQGLRLVDSTGKQRPDLGDGSASVPVDGRMSLTFDVRLPVLPRTEMTIKALEGRLSAVVPTRMVPVALGTLAVLEAAPNLDAPELAFPKGTPAGRVSRIVRTRDRWSVQVVLPTPPGGDMFESYQSWVVQNEATLRTADGKVWKSAGYLLEGNTPTRSVATYHFLARECPDKADPALWRFHYTTPAGIVRMDVPFKFSDVPLR